jgi:multiple sugar transport system ATP-binding protein
MGQGIDWDINSVNLPQLRSHAGRSVVVGLRPEDMILSGATNNHRNNLAVQIRVLERLGDMVIIYGDHGVYEITAKLPPHTAVEIDQQLWLEPRIERLHFFDPTHGNTLT